MNLSKRDMLYNKGMKIAMHSKLSKNKEWFRGGEEIQYIYNDSMEIGRASCRERVSSPV